MKLNNELLSYIQAVLLVVAIVGGLYFFMIAFNAHNTALFFVGAFALLCLPPSIVFGFRRIDKTLTKVVNNEETN